MLLLNKIKTPKRCEICNITIDRTLDKELVCEYCGKHLCPECVDWRISDVYKKYAYIVCVKCSKDAIPY